ncbi:hypothetical protein T9A_01804 [Alcanivorax jadensis T9]|jgi:hypothetical protein|uniref:Uncharacterized protein n=1 Tax=Alcanivorax jadensis T9 TaxID=1177181 RepID=A0ABR4WDD6_9GAMM|nr:hypothetical protein [Alcanivorax jadensis]KGD61355.1 hypothetical protein T9A_01804 [Alcanivorax jadensis T9]MBP21156.1 hypothetical protein [Alcanivorax sp.]
MIISASGAAECSDFPLMEEGLRADKAVKMSGFGLIYALSPVIFFPDTKNSFAVSDLAGHINFDRRALRA